MAPTAEALLAQRDSLLPGDFGRAVVGLPTDQQAIVFRQQPDSLFHTPHEFQQAFIQQLPEDAQRKLMTWRLNVLARQAPTSLRAHTQLVHRTDNDVPMVAFRHHDEWVRVLEDREQYPYVVVVAPPGYAKSSWFSIAYPTWRIGQSGGKIRMGLIANTHSVARGFSGAIQAAIETDRFQMAYPNVRPDEERAWRENEWAVTGLPPGPNFTMMAYGMNGPVQSRRFDEIVLDDPTTWQQALSPSIMENQRRWVRNTLIKRFPPGMRPPKGKGGRMVVVLTRWSVDDLVPTFRQLGFKIVTMPALGYWDGVQDELGEFVPGEEPLWPEMEGLADLLAQREEDEIIFELVMQGNPKVLSGDMFDPASFQRGVPPKREEYDRIVMAVDTASGKDRKKGDYFALATLGTLGAQVWVDSVKKGIFNAVEQERAVMTALGLEPVGLDAWRVQDEALWRTRPTALVIEDKNEGTALWQRLVARHIPVRILPAQANYDKETRASPLATAYRSNYVWHPAWPDEEGELTSIPAWVRSYEAEAQAFPDGPHDDQVDAVAHAYNHLGYRGPRIRAA
jgi:predicted phage terminase large subunit-like protein